MPIQLNMMEVMTSLTLKVCLEQAGEDAPDRTADGRCQQAGEPRQLELDGAQQGEE